LLPTEAHQLAGRLERRHIPVHIQSVQTGDRQGDLIIHNGGEAGGGHEGSSRKGGVNTLIVPLPVVRRVGPQGPAPGQSPYLSPLLLSRLVGLRAQPSLELLTENARFDVSGAPISALYAFRSSLDFQAIAAFSAATKIEK